MTAIRRCSCGRRINEYNPDKVCFPCKRQKWVTELEGSLQPATVEKPPSRRGPKPKECCPQGHSYAIHGRQRKDHGRACQICTAVRKRTAYNKKKEANP